jgi:hypothetical protein
VLQAYHVNVVEIQECGAFLIRLHIVLTERPSDPGGIVIAFIGIVDRESQQSSSSVLGGNGATKIGGKRRDSAMSWKIIPDDRDTTRQG